MLKSPRKIIEQMARSPRVTRLLVGALVLRELRDAEKPR
jgi:hypothetical protein